MKFKIVRSKFLEGLKSVQGIVASKGSLPILQNVMMDAKNGALTLTTTDLDISIVASVPCDVLVEGSSTIPVKFLFNAISKVVEGEVEVETDGNERATICAGNAKFKFAGLPSADFPKPPVDEEAFTYKIQQATFKDMLRKVAYAASQDDTRRTLKGVLMSFKDQKLTMVATDGRRLALVEQEVEFPQDAEKDVILPSKAVSELQRTLNGEGELEMVIQKSQICFKVESLMLYTKLVDEVYPNYRQVIPVDERQEILIDRQLLLDALDRVRVLSMEEAHSTKLIFSSGKLTVTSAASDIGEAKDEVPIKYAGDEIEILFDPSYIMDCLKAIDDDEVSINLADGHAPAIIKCSIPFLYVLMPLRIG